MPAEEVELWDDYFSYEPPLEIRLDWMRASIVAAIYQCFGGSKKTSKDYYPDYENPKVQTAESLSLKVSAAFAMAASAPKPGEIVRLP